MQTIEIEVNGKKQVVTLAQLRTLVARRFIKPDATAWADGEELKVSELLERFSPSEEQVASQRAKGRTNKNEPEKVAVPLTNFTTSEQGKVVVPPSNSATSESKVNNSKKIVGAFKFLGVGAVLLVVTVVAIAIGYYGGARKSKPATGKQTPNVAADSVAEGGSTERTEVGNSSERGWEPFDRRWKTIPRSYSGCSCPALCEEILIRFAESEERRSRGEFETLEEYQSRMAREEKAIEQSAISGNVHFGSTVGFPLVPKEEAEKSSSFSARYDVDQKTWTIALNFLEPGVRSARDNAILIPLCFEGSSEKYSAVNAFNAKFEVTKTTIDGFGVCVATPNSQGISPRYGNTLDLVLNDVPLDFAKEKKGKLSGFCVCDLAYEKPFFDTDHLDPTFSQPSELDMSHDYVRAENLEFWFYDKTTGEVVTRFSLAEAFSGKPKDFANARIVSNSSDDLRSSPLNNKSGKLESSVSETNNLGETNAEGATEGQQGESAASNNNLPQNRNRVGRRRLPANRSSLNRREEPANPAAQQSVENESASVPDKPTDAAASSEQIAANQPETEDDSNGFSEMKNAEGDDLESKTASFDSTVSQDDEKKLDEEKLFDRSWDIIPESYDANNCTGLYYEISRRCGDVEKQRSKGEFETTAEFRARMKRVQRDIAQTVISGDVRFGSTVAFPFFPAELKSPHFGKISTQYNADQKRWILTIDFVMSVGVNGENNFAWLNIPIYLNGEKETYTGVNGFNMEVEVTKWLFREYGVQVEFPRLKNFNGSYINGYETLSFILGNVPVEVAKEKKGRVAGYCVCDVECVEPYFNWFYIKPKFSSPYGFDVYRRFIVVSNLEFWFYDMKTREVIAKYSLDEASRRKIKNYADAKIIAGRVSGTSKTSSQNGEETDETEPIPTWEDVLSEAVDATESWESKKPTITIPDDAASLEEALTKSGKGDVIFVKATEKPIPLKSKKAARGESSDVLVDHAVAIVGESNEKGSAIVEIDAEETLRIDSRDLVAFKGLTFSARKSPSANSVEPIIAVSNDSKAKFKECEFLGNAIEEATGVVVEGEFASVSFWKCQFQQFGVEGLRVQDSAKATLEYCQFLEKNRYGLSSLSGAAVKVDKSRFDGNVTGFQAEGGGGVVASNSFFSANRSNWSISSGSRNACDTKEGNVVEK